MFFAGKWKPTLLLLLQALHILCTLLRKMNSLSKNPKAWNRKLGIDRARHEALKTSNVTPPTSSLTGSLTAIPRPLLLFRPLVGNFSCAFQAGPIKKHYFFERIKVHQ